MMTCARHECKGCAHSYDKNTTVRPAAEDPCTACVRRGGSIDNFEPRLP